jgi:hypothetical protein
MSSGEFPRRVVAIQRIEYVVRPPSPEAEGDDYDRYETDRYKVMQLIEEEAGDSQPHDLRVIEGDDETIISYQVKRVVIKDR